MSIKDRTLRFTVQLRSGGTDLPLNVRTGQPIVVGLDNLYATASVTRLDVPLPSIVGRCSTEYTEVPYVLQIMGKGNASINLWVGDENLAKRIARAFEHLIRISGGKEEAF